MFCDNPLLDDICARKHIRETSQDWYRPGNLQLEIAKVTTSHTAGVRALCIGTALYSIGDGRCALGCAYTYIQHCITVVMMFIIILYIGGGKWGGRIISFL